MSESKPVVGLIPAPPSETEAVWIGRPSAGPSRHRAIASKLPSYTQYKHWAEKMKGSFEPTVPPKPGGTSGNGR